MTAEEFEQGFAVLQKLAPAELLENSQKRWQFFFTPNPQSEEWNEFAESVEAWKHRCHVQALLGREMASLAAIETAVELHGCSKVIGEVLADEGHVGHVWGKSPLQLVRIEPP